MKRFFLFFLFFFSISLFFPPKVSAVIFFEDNFDSGSSTQWSPINGNWIVRNGTYGAEIIPRYTIIESLAGNMNWTDYIYEVDMYAFSGVDKNLIFRVSNDGRTKYGIHMVHTGIYLEKHIDGRGWDMQNLDYRNDEVGFATGAYKIKVVLDGKNIKVYVDNVLQIEHTDLEPNAILSGKIGLRIGTGGVAPSEVYFDNVVVRSLEDGDGEDGEEERKPVVLVPGHGASWCLNAIVTGGGCSEWKMTPFIKVYDNLIATLENAGYVQNQDFFIFYYDWRKRIDSLADELAAFLQEKIPSDQEALLVGHSMGGLISRAYLQKTAGPPVEKLLTIGSPHQGVLIAYPAWAGGEIWNDNTWQWLGLQLLLQIHKNGFATNMEALRHFSPSTQDFLPIFNYLFKDNQEVDVNTMHSQNNWLKTLTATENLVTLNGDQHHTLEAIDVENRSWLDEYLGKWSDGKPQNKRFSNQGDETVLLSSARINNVPTETLNLQHSGLISETSGIAKIIELLGLNISTIVNQTQVPVATPALVFFLHSPANLSLENPPANTLISQEDNLIIVPNPQSGQYQLQVTGIDNGSYHLEIGQIMADESFWQTVSGDTYPGEQETLVINFDSSHPQENPLADATGSLNLEIAKTKIKELKSYVNQLNIRTAVKSRLVYDLDKILRSLERFPRGLQLQRSLADLYQLRININQWQKYNLISENESIYLKNSLMEIIGFLENSYRRMMLQSGQTADRSRIQRDIQTVNGLLSHWEPKIKNKNQALVYELAQEKLSRANEEFGAGEYFYSQILAYSARMLVTELSQLVR